MNNFYNYGTQGNEAPLTEVIIEFIKETIISKDKDRLLFKEVKKQKRRNSHSLTLEITDKLIIDNVILSENTNANKKHYSDKSSSTKFSSLQDNGNELQTKNGMESGFNTNYFSVRDAIAQNINIEDKIRLMIVSNGNDFIMKSLILYIMNEDWVSECPLLTIKNKVFQFTNKKTLLLSLYNTQLALHSNPICKGINLF